jgi:hypothetical protein
VGKTKSRVRRPDSVLVFSQQNMMMIWIPLK